MSPRKLIAGWSAIIVLWCVICAGWWFAASWDDYAKLAAAQACYGPAVPAASPSLECANIKPTDALLYKAAIDHKATVSRLSGALGAMVAIGALILGRARARSK